MHTSNATIRRYEEIARETGCVISGAKNEVQIHHVIGRKGKHNKELIGPLFILPLHRSYHEVTSANPCAYHRNKRAFVEEYGQPSRLFEKWVMKVVDYGFEEDQLLIVKLLKPEKVSAIADFEI